MTFEQRTESPPAKRDWQNIGISLASFSLTDHRAVHAAELGRIGKSIPGLPPIDFGTAEVENEQTKKNPLDVAVSDPNVKGREAVMVFLQKRGSTDFSEENLKKWSDHLEQLPRALYGHKGAVPEFAIRPEAIKQGKLGDCYFLAALGSMAATDRGKHQIKNMIKANYDGNDNVVSYTVTFPGAPDEPIEVAPPTDAELLLYAQSTENGVWPNVLEKAFGVYCSRDLLRRNVVTNQQARTIPHENLDGGALFEHGLAILTGKRQQYVTMDRGDAKVASGLLILTGQWLTTGWHPKSKDAMENIMIKAMAEQQPMTAAQPKGYGLPDSKHVYSILAYNPETKMVTLRDPNGWIEPREGDKPRDGKADGTWQMSYDDFYAAFLSIGVGGQPEEVRTEERTVMDSPMQQIEPPWGGGSGGPMNA